jgi:hypothetical protein
MIPVFRGSSDAMREREPDDLAAWRLVQDLHQPMLPKAAHGLTWAGLLPFLAALAAWGLGLWTGEARGVVIASKAFLVYSAVILSFLGGVRWGRAMSAGAPPPAYVLAVLPSLWAFPALFLPEAWSIAALATGFALALWFDTRADHLPATPGFRQLRRRISAAVIAAHAAALALSLG